MKTKLDETLADLARLYRLVEDMRATVARLKEVVVEVRITRYNDLSDPVATAEQLHVTLHPGCDIYPGPRG